MTYALEQAVMDLLVAARLRVPRRYIDMQLKSHPQYPSLACITDTLDELHIPNAAIQVDSEQRGAVPTPFLAHLTSPAEEFVVVTDINRAEQQYPDFARRWDGVVVVIEPTAASAVAVRPQWKRSVISRASLWTLGCAAVVFLLTALVHRPSWSNIVVLVTASLGIALSGLIVQKEWGQSNALTDKVCGAGGADCQRVLGSGGAMIGEWLKWSDVGIIYFVSCFLVFGQAWRSNSSPSTFESAVAVWSTLAVLSVPMILFSIYYQWRVAKTWCTLCMLVMALLVAQLSALLPVFAHQSPAQFVSSWSRVGPSVAVGMAAVAAIWLPVRHLIEERDRLVQSLLPALKFKRNPSIFLAALSQQRRAPTAPLSYDLQIGNPTAPTQLMVACNPYCFPCAKAHAVIHTLLQDPNLSIGVSLRFTINAEHADDVRTVAVRYILQHLLQDDAARTDAERRSYCQTVLHEWFDVMDLDKFRATHPVTSTPDVGEILMAHTTWTSSSHIVSTPTVFLNGARLPDGYGWMDLPSLRHLFLDISQS